MAWFLLIAAGLLEVVWAVALKRSDGFTRLWASVTTVAAMLASFALLAAAVKHLPVGTAYAVWTGIGATGTAIVGMAWLGEPRDAARLACLAAIVGGIVGLKLLTIDKATKT